MGRKSRGQRDCRGYYVTEHTLIVALNSVRVVWFNKRGRFVVIWPGMLWRETVKLLSLVVVCALAARAVDLALVGGRIFTAPDAAPLTNGMVLIHDGRITSVGAGTLKLPGGTQRLDCTGRVVTAGFWNCHVHFSEPKWENAVALPAAQLAAQTRDMFTRWGFTSVVDAGSVLANTKAIRRRMEAGEFPGPMILSAGTPFTPKEPHPIICSPSSFLSWSRPSRLPRSLARGSMRERTPSRSFRAPGSRGRKWCPWRWS